MSSFPAVKNCDTYPSVTDDTKLLEQYIGPAPDKAPGLLAATSNPASDRDANNTLKSSVLDGIINSLITKNIIPVANSINADAYHATVVKFLDNVNSEFCFYKNRYSTALRLLFAAIREGFNSQNDANKQDVNRKLKIVEQLNTKLNDFTLIVHKISKNIRTKSDRLQAEIDKFNTDIEAQRVSLNYQNGIITSGNKEITIRKEMVKFTEEKARNSDNLLKLYSFLNVVVLGLLVYVYKAASD